MDSKRGSVPWLQDPDVTLWHGDVLATLRELPAESVDMVCTSPPYWGLRSYLDNEHDDKPLELGLESTPEQYVERMVEVFREVRRVLAAHGTVWLNLGDSYAGSNRGSAISDEAFAKLQGDTTKPVGDGGVRPTARQVSELPSLPSGLKQKDLCGIPWRVAFALQADGWCLRSDVVWSKPNPMPESVTDRPTKAHEMVFLLSKATWKGPERGQFAEISDEDARWLALLFDTEGNIVIKRAERESRVQYGAQMAFANTNRELLERARGIVGTGSLHERPGKNAPVYYWQMTGRQARDLLYRIYPFLIVKQRQARVAIHMQDVVAEPKKRPGGYRSEEHTAFLDRCWQTVKALNQFGDPDLSWVPEVRYGRWVPNRYFFDQEAVREKAEWARWGDQTNGKHEGSGSAAGWIGSKPKAQLQGGRHARRYSAEEFKTTDERNTRFQGPNPVDGGRNIRSVWPIATQPYPEAHFATFPEELARRCIAAGCPEQVCRVCGKPRERVVEREFTPQPSVSAAKGIRGHDGQKPMDASSNWQGVPRGSTSLTTLGFSDCQCDGFCDSCNGSGVTGPELGICGRCQGEGAVEKYRPGIVLDPFMGSGTVAHVARKLGRHAVGVDLNESYLQLAAKRLQQQSLFAEAL